MGSLSPSAFLDLITLLPSRKTPRFLDNKEHESRNLHEMCSWICCLHGPNLGRVVRLTWAALDCLSLYPVLLKKRSLELDLQHQLYKCSSRYVCQMFHLGDAATFPSAMVYKPVQGGTSSPREPLYTDSTEIPAMTCQPVAFYSSTWW